jgi:hypothetical protein
MTASSLLKQIRGWVIFFMIALIVSGITAFPVYTELKWIINTNMFSNHPLLSAWLNKVWTGVKTTQENFPFLFYGFDWLAFAHLAIALLFIGVYKNPVKNKWIVYWAMIICIGIFFLAFIAGSIRGIPLFHILIDCSFGVVGFIPLLIVRRKILLLENIYQQIKTSLS